MRPNPQLQVVERHLSGPKELSTQPLLWYAIGITVLGNKAEKVHSHATHSLKYLKSQLHPSQTLEIQADKPLRGCHTHFE